MANCSRRYLWLRFHLTARLEPPSGRAADHQARLPDMPPDADPGWLATPVGMTLRGGHDRTGDRARPRAADAGDRDATKAMPVHLHIGVIAWATTFRRSPLRHPRAPGGRRELFDRDLSLIEVRRDKSPWPDEALGAATRTTERCHSGQHRDTKAGVQANRFSVGCTEVHMSPAAESNRDRHSASWRSAVGPAAVSSQPRTHPASLARRRPSPRGAVRSAPPRLTAAATDLLPRRSRTARHRWLGI